MDAWAIKDNDGCRGFNPTINWSWGILGEWTLNGHCEQAIRKTELSNPSGGFRGGLRNQMEMTESFQPENELTILMLAKVE